MLFVDMRRMANRLRKTSNFSALTKNQRLWRFMCWTESTAQNREGLSWRCRFITGLAAHPWLAVKAAAYW
jgi:hypothetical protein